MIILLRTLYNFTKVRLQLWKIPVCGEQVPGLGPDCDVLGVEVADAGEIHQGVVTCTYTMLLPKIFLDKDSSAYHQETTQLPCDEDRYIGCLSQPAVGV